MNSTQSESESEDDSVIIEAEFDGTPLEIPVCVPHGNFPITLKHRDSYYLKGRWLSDEDIGFFMKLLKKEFPNQIGLELPNFFCAKQRFLKNKTNEFVRILYCDNKHWITVSGGSVNENIYLYDSMDRSVVNDFLGNQLEKMMPLTIKDLPVIKIQIQNTQKQEETLCGFFACAFATALCNQVDIENLIFDKEKLTSHWLGCIKNQRAIMFPCSLKEKTTRKEQLIIEYIRGVNNTIDIIPKQKKSNSKLKLIF
jgi:Ulp1 family protease